MPGLREELLGLDDRKVVEVTVPEWGGRVVRVAAMSAFDRDQWETQNYQAIKAGARRNVRAALVARCVVDETMVRVFADDDIEALGQKNAKALDRLFDVASDLNGLNEKSAEAVAKN